MSKEVEERLSPPKKAVEPPSDLIVDEVAKNEMLLYVNLLNMAQPTDPNRTVYLVVCLYLKSMRSHFELA